jgi:hypothetical protein
MQGPIFEHVLAAFFMGAMFGLLLDDALAWFIDRRSAKNRDRDER